MTTKKRKDPFSQGMEGYATFINQLYDAVFANMVAWGIDPLAVAAFLAVLTPFNTAWNVSKNKSTSTSVNRQTTKSGRGVVNALARKFVQKWIYLNENMTDADIKACGLEPRDKVRSTIGKPDTEPDMYLKPMTSHNIKGFFRQPEEEPGVRKRGKPAGVKSVKVAIFVGKDVPAEPDDYGRFIDSTVVGVTIPFNSSLKGQPVTISGCWVNEKEQQGDWCEPVTITIP
jgi:hypothetical protein